MAIEGSGYAITGVTVFGTGPIGRPVHVPFNREITALYGLNGAGKSRLLAGIAAALSGVQPPDDRSVTEERPGAHLHVRLRPETGTRLEDLLFDVVSTELMRARARLVERTLGRSEMEDLLSIHLRPPDPSSDLPLDDALTDLFSLLDAESHRLDDEQHAILGSLAAGNDFVFMATGSSDAPAWTVPAALPIRQPDNRRLVAEYFRSRTLQARLRSDLNAGGRTKDETKALVTAFSENAPTSHLSGLADEHLNPYGAGTASFRAASLPDWLSVPIRVVGTTQVALVEVQDGSTSSRSADEDTAAALLTTFERSGRPWELVVLRSFAQEIAKTANATLRRVLPQREPALTFEVLDDLAWFRGERPHWGAWLRDGTGPHPLAALSGAHRRWAELAIKLSLTNAQDRPVVFLCDEPEAGLHRLAEVQLPAGLARAMAEHGAAAVVATHSPHLLDGRHVAPVLVERDGAGQTIAQPITVTTLDALDAELSRHRLGLTPGGLLDLMRVAVLVEGLHDELLFKTLLRSELEQSMAGVYALRGAKGLRSVAEATLLFEGSNAPVLLVLDNTQPELEAAWEAASQVAEIGDIERARGLLAALDDGTSGEARWLRQLGEAALTTGRLDRIHLFGMTQIDAVCYLPAESLLINGLTWDLAVQEYTEWLQSALAEGQPRQNFKRWLTSTKRARTFSDSAVRHAVELLHQQVQAGAQVHPDLANLGARIEALAVDR